MQEWDQQEAGESTIEALCTVGIEEEKEEAVRYKLGLFSPEMDYFTVDYHQRMRHSSKQFQYFTFVMPDLPDPDGGKVSNMFILLQEGLCSDADGAV